MKVFAFNPDTGVKGELLCEIGLAHAVSNPERQSCQLPPVQEGVEWAVATRASDINDKPIQFNQPVCFCLGKWWAGTDGFWHWIVLLPPDDR